MFLFNNNIYAGNLLIGRINRGHQAQINNIQYGADRRISITNRDFGAALGCGYNGFSDRSPDNDRLCANYGNALRNQSYLDQLAQYSQYLQQQLALTRNRLLDYNLSMKCQIQNINCVNGLNSMGGMNNLQHIFSVSPGFSQSYYGSLCGTVGGCQGLDAGVVTGTEPGFKSAFLSIGGGCSESSNSPLVNNSGSIVNADTCADIQGKYFFNEYDILLLPKCENKLTVRDVSHSELSLKSALEKDDSEIEVVIRNGDKSVELDCLRDELLIEEKIHCDSKLANEIVVDIYERDQENGDVEDAVEGVRESREARSGDNDESKSLLMSEEICQELIFDSGKGENLKSTIGGDEKNKGEIEIDEDSLLVIKYRNNEKIEQDVLNIMEDNISNCVIDGSSYYCDSNIDGYQCYNNQMLVVNNSSEFIELANGNVVDVGSEIEFLGEGSANARRIIPLKYLTFHNACQDTRMHPAEPRIHRLQEETYYDEMSDSAQQTCENGADELLDDKVVRYNLLLEKINKMEEMNILMKRVVLDEKRRYYAEMNSIQDKRDGHREKSESRCLDKNNADSLEARSSLETIKDDFKSNATSLHFEEKGAKISDNEEDGRDENSSESKDKKTSMEMSLRDSDFNDSNEEYIRDQESSIESENDYGGSEEHVEGYIRAINSYFSNHGIESSCNSTLNTQRWEAKYQTAMNSLNDQIKQQEEEGYGEDKEVNKDMAIGESSQGIELEENGKDEQGNEQVVRTEAANSDLRGKRFGVAIENDLVISDHMDSCNSSKCSDDESASCRNNSKATLLKKTENAQSSPPSQNYCKIKDNEILERLSQRRVINSKNIRNLTAASSPQSSDHALNVKPSGESLEKEKRVENDDDNLGFQFLINNGIKVRVSELTKPRIIKKLP